jgi:hypothetical protein
VVLFMPSVTAGLDTGIPHPRHYPSPACSRRTQPPERSGTATGNCCVKPKKQHKPDVQQYREATVYRLMEQSRADVTSHHPQDGLCGTAV